MTNSKNDWCFRQMSSRQRKTIGFETIFFKKNMSNKKILKVMKFQGLDRVKVHFMVRCHVLSVLGCETNKKSN